MSNLLEAKNLSRFFQEGDELIKAVNNINFSIKENEKIVIYGRSGSGKSTLLKIIHSNSGFDSGSVNLQKEMKVGYLSQDIDFVKGNTVIEETEKAFERIKHLQSELYSLQSDLVKRTDYESESYLELINISSEYEHELNL